MKAWIGFASVTSPTAADVYQTVVVLTGQWSAFGHLGMWSGQSLPTSANVATVMSSKEKMMHVITSVAKRGSPHGDSAKAQSRRCVTMETETGRNFRQKTVISIIPVD